MYIMKDNMLLLTSEEVAIRAFQSRRGRRFVNRRALISISSLTSSASLGFRGKAAAFPLHALTLQHRKLRVRTFTMVNGVLFELD